MFLKDNFTAIGLDLGDKYSVFCGLDDNGDVLEEGRIRTNPAEIESWFSKINPTQIAIEASTISAWVSRVLTACGHDVTVANPNKIALIGQNSNKSDRTDAQLLARLLRADKKLLSPIQHRGKQAQADMSAIRSRDLLVRNRTKLVNHVRSSLKVFGICMSSCSTASFSKQVVDYIPDELNASLYPIVKEIEHITETICFYTKYLNQVAEKRYPETKLLRQVGGVGLLTALAFILTIEDPTRFKKSRSVGPFFGLCPRSDRSSTQNPQLHISKTGNGYMRSLLVCAAHYILGPFGPPCYLRSWGLKLAERGGKNAKKRAAVAVARRLAVLLHHLWITGEEYEPLRGLNKESTENGSAVA